ncbi:hypothetical protein V5O48_018221, partial [Marasmius crinis-equi]
VWRTIFRECLPSNDLGLCTRTMKEAPLLFTNICHFWQEIVMTTPSLWNSVHIFIPAPSREFVGEIYVSIMRARIDGFRKWLDRSMSLPITISISSQRSWYDGPLDPFPGVQYITQPDAEQASQSSEPYRTLRREFLELVAQYSRRWRTLAYGGPDSRLDFSPFDTLTTQDLGLLQDVHSFGILFPFQEENEATVSGSPSPLANLLSRTSCLRTLRLVGDTISERALSSSVGWSRLTELSISHIYTSTLTPGQIIHTLAKQCHSLTTLSLEICGFRRRNEDMLPLPIEWPSLQDLNISFNTNSYTIDPNGHAPIPTFMPVITNTFNTVIFPFLTRFSVMVPYTISFTNHFDPDKHILDYTPFDTLLSTSQCPLVHLEIACPQHLTVEAHLRILRPLDGLASLKLGHSTFPRRIHTGDVQNDHLSRLWCSELLQATELGSLCPELEDVSLQGCYVDDVEAILGFAMQRPRLKTLRAGFGRISSRAGRRLLEPREEMKVLREKGIDLYWEYTEDVREQPHDSANDGMPGLSDWW